jgi:2-succinyl-5-enolpyruvyl-6-hydroxy-3-cyclohexene-1-carboxylate synthase
MVLGNLQHLWTPVKGRLKNNVSLFQLLHNLHPTPAVGGIPTARACHWISQQESSRGASGIDGNISTFLGLAAAHKGQGKPVAVIVDLAFFHDMNGLVAAKGLNAMLIVINNNGGGIFQRLPQKELPGFDKYWRTPLDLDYSCAARMYGLQYHELSDANQISSVLGQALEEEGVSLVELVTEASEDSALQSSLSSTLVSSS